MAAKGSIAKTEIFNKMLEVFPGSFMAEAGKECRINWVENGEEVQIKVTLTAAKVAIEGGSAVSAASTPNVASTTATTASSEPQVMEPTDEEKQRISDFLKNLF